MEFEQLKSFLLQPISSLNIRNFRIVNCLRNEQIHFVAQLFCYDEAEFLHFPNFGRISLGVLNQKLAPYGLSLGEISYSWIESRDAIRLASHDMEKMQRAIDDLTPEKMFRREWSEGSQEVKNASNLLIAQTLFPEKYTQALSPVFRRSVLNDIAEHHVFVDAVRDLKNTIKSKLRDNILDWVDAQASKPIDDVAGQSVNVSSLRGKILEQSLLDETLEGLDSRFKKTVLVRLLEDSDFKTQFDLLEKNVDDIFKSQIIKKLGLDRAPN